MRVGAEALQRSYESECLAENVPRGAKARNQWMIWEPERTASGRVNKAPRRANDGIKASKTDRANYSSFEGAVRGARRLGYPGIGICLTDEDPIVAIDRDHCVDGKTGEIDAETLMMIDVVGSYTELSPGRRGIRILCVGSLTRNIKTEKIEMYHRDAFLTVTGDVIRGGDLREAQAALDALTLRYGKSEPKRAQRRTYEGPPGERLDLLEFLASAGVVVFGEVSDGTAQRVFRILCPWVHEHTGGDASGTRVGQYPDGALFFFCEHAHCANRRWTEFRSEVAPRPSAGGGKVYARRRGTVSIG